MALKTTKYIAHCSPQKEGEIPEAIWQLRRLTHSRNSQAAREEYHWSLILLGTLNWVGKEAEQRKIKKGGIRKILLHDSF